jgi:hypothetical protein
MKQSHVMKDIGVVGGYLLICTCGWRGTIIFPLAITNEAVKEYKQHANG